MSNTRDRQRDEYIFNEREKGRKFKDIGDELGITQQRVREIYERACRDIRWQYMKKNPEAYKAWMSKQGCAMEDFVPVEYKGKA